MQVLAKLRGIIITDRPVASLLGALGFGVVLVVAGPSESRATEAATVLSGEVRADNGTQVVESASAAFSLSGTDGESPLRMRTRVRLKSAPEGIAPPALLTFAQMQPEDRGSEGLGRVSILRSSGEQDGNVVRFQTQRLTTDTNKWGSDEDPRLLVFWPNDKKAAKVLEEDGFARKSWHDRWINLRIDLGRDAVTVWAEGVLVAALPRGERQAALPVVLTLAEGDAIAAVEREAWTEDPRFLPLDLREAFNEQADHAIAAGSSDIPFNLSPEQRDLLSLRQAGWADQKRDPQSFYEAYDGGPSFVNDPRMPMVSVPKADYIAAHLLAVAEVDPDLTNTITLRAGRYGYQKQVLQREFMGAVPRGDVPGGFTHVRVPLTEAFAQDILGGVIEIELTKEVRLARHVPDPNRFRYRPLGLPSGVRIAAITLERSPLQMTVTSGEAGHAFVEPRTPSFRVRLSNITAMPQPYELLLEASHLHGGSSQATRSGSVPAGQSADVEIPIAAVHRGYHDLSVTLSQPDKGTLLRRTTSFAQLAPDTREHRDESPFGTWEWNGTHVTPTDSDAIGSLYKKIGFRFGMSNHPRAAREKWGVVVSSEPKLDPELKRFKKIYEREPNMPLRGLVFHEDSISGAHVTRVPDLFHDRPPYKLNEEEEKRYATMLAQALGGAKAAREQFPGIAISFGNGPLPTKEEFYRRGFPAELFDFGGNEAGSFHRLPETQPPDGIANNASLWMDRLLLDAYGYSDKPVHQCIEVGYPNDNPGNHTPAAQADYFVRNALHSLAWGMKFIHVGEITDVGNSYYFSNWGAAGFCRAYPEINVKPAFVAMATLTSVLDGATFTRAHETGSATLYGLEFERADGERVLAVWSIRGRRPVSVSRTGDNWRVIDDQGNESVASTEVMATPTPVYLVGRGDITAIVAGAPTYQNAPPREATVVEPLASMTDWTVEQQRSAELESYNPLEPRRKGDFEFAVATFEGEAPAIGVTARPITHGKDTMPMYAVLVHERGVDLPGSPDEIGVWINGNSGWGRVIYELVDASGQRWVSLGAAATGDAAPWLTDWMPQEMQGQLGAGAGQNSDWSTNDPYGVSRINFDGWRYVPFPLPGNYPGERHPWPANSYWRWDGDGVVKHPLRLTRLVVELPEKVLHVKAWQPPKRASIYLKNLTVANTRPLLDVQGARAD